MNIIEHLETKKIDKMMFQIFSFAYTPFKKNVRFNYKLTSKEKTTGSYILGGYFVTMLLIMVIPMI